MISSRLIFGNAALLVIVKCFALTSSLMVMPLYLEYFNYNQIDVSVWLTLFVVLYSFYSIDFGVGSRVKNDLLGVYSSGFDCDRKSVRIITKGFVSYVLIGSIFFFIFLAFYLSCILFEIPFFIDSDGALDYDKTSQLFIVAIYLFLSVPLRIVIPILQARQKNALSGLLLSSPQIIVFLYLYFADNSFGIFGLSKIVELLIVLLVLHFCLYVFFFKFFVNLNLLLIRKMLSKLRVMFFSLFKIFKASFSFFVVQICFLALFSSNEIFYSILGQPELVVEYQYYYRPFSLFFVAFSVFSLPFWSAIRSCYVSGRFNEAKRYGFFLIILNFMVLIAILPFSYYFDVMLDLWLGSGFYDVKVDYLILFCFFSFFMCSLMTVTALLNSFDSIKAQAGTLVFVLCVKIFFIFLFDGFSFDSVLYSTVISSFLSVFLLSFYTYFEWKKYFN